METRYLLPRQCKKIGWLLFLPALVASIILWFNNYDFDMHFQAKVFAIVNSDIMSKPQNMAVIENGVADEILLAMIIIGGLMVGFSKLKNEDELIAKIRYESLVWAVYFNFAIMLFATLTIYGTCYFSVLVANVFTLLFFFIIRFHVMIFKLNKSTEDEE